MVCYKRLLIVQILEIRDVFFVVMAIVSVFLFFFFFQAEDGIRDLTVTGVQTCALPIWKLDGWQGPPGPFIYFVTRSDAVDVVYGTVEGYESLGIPYMPHIAPEKRW